MKQSEVASAAWKGLIWKFLEKSSSQLISLIVSIILARLLLPEQFGIIVMTMIFIALTETFVTGGLGSALIQSSKYDEHAFSTMFWASVFFSIILYGLLFLSAPWISEFMHTPALVSVLRVLGLRLPISAMNSIQQAYVSQQMIFKKFFFSTLSGSAVSGIIGIFMAYAGFGVWALVAQSLSMTIVNTAVLHFIITWRPTLYFNLKIFTDLFGFSWRVMLANFIGTFFDQFRGFLIGRYYKPQDLAFANRGELFPTALAGNISTSIQAVLFPAFSHLKNDKSDVQAALKNALTMGSFIIVGLMVVMAGVSDTLIKVILTEKWMDSVPYLQWVCFGQCFSVLGMINLQTITAMGRADVTLKLEFIKKPFCLAILLICVTITPLAVIIGNAFYGVIAFAVNAFPNKTILYYGLREQVGDIIPPFILAVPVFVMLQYFQYILPQTFFSLILESAVGGLLYVLLSCLFHVPGALQAYQIILSHFKH